MKQLQVEITNACNFACEFCPHPTSARPVEHMSMATFQAIVDDVLAQGVTRRISLHMLGEPLLHPELTSAVRYAAAQGLEVDVTTNGSLLDAERIRQLAGAGLRLLSISLVGTRPEEHALRHARLDRDTYYRRLLDAVREARSPKRDLAVRVRVMSTWSRFLFSVPRDIWINHGGRESRETLVHLVDDLMGATGRSPGMARVRQAVSKIPHRRDLILDLRPGLSVQVHTFLDWGNAFADKPVHPTTFGACPLALTTASVLSSGDVVPCAADFDGAIRLGNVRDAPLSEILQSDTANRIRAGVRRGRFVHPHCRRCAGSTSRLWALCKGLAMAMLFRLNSKIDVQHVQLFPNRARRHAGDGRARGAVTDSGPSLPALGIDLGACTVKAVLLGSDGDERTVVQAHRGRPGSTLRSILQGLAVQPASVALTGDSGKRAAAQLGLRYIDPLVALLANPRSNGEFRHIIDIGGSSASIADLDALGRLAAHRESTLCAAGTGAFLDDQAARLGITEEERSGTTSITDPPRVASRCAVFAKSDLIHYQQEGRSRLELWSGLCRGMVSSAISTLFRGRKPEGPVLFVGGVARTGEVHRWLESELGVPVRVPEQPQVCGARGASREAVRVRAPVRWQELRDDPDSDAAPRRPLLTLRRSARVDFDRGRELGVDGIELGNHGALQSEVVLGLDVGSTSTKVAVLDLEGRLLADLYRPTKGEPIAATQALFGSLVERWPVGEVTVRALGVTGSGRQMLGTLLQADAVVNEITAHVTSAVASDPDVTTLIEIGGQDSKFVSLRNGRPVDACMNHLCAGGTGAFIEEQANRLGVDVRDVGELALGSRPPASTDRCTVFMAQDIDAMIRRRLAVPEILGAVLHSVARNYVKRVVQHRHIRPGKICFMGATARNIGLVAAFEELLQAPIVVSPWCHVMGALGVAQIARRKTVEQGRPSRFVGLAQALEPVGLTAERCRLCSNDCRIIRARVEGGAAQDEVSWGYLCGREPTSRGPRKVEGYEAFRQRERLWVRAGQQTAPATGGPRVGVPRALLAYSHMPFWRSFFSRLGAEVVLSPPTGKATLDRARTHCSAEFCHPVHVANGHVAGMLEDPSLDMVFAPQMLKALPHDDGWRESVYCPYITTFGSLARTVAAELGATSRLHSPVVQFRWPPGQAARELADSLGRALRVGRRALHRAWQHAQETQREFEAQSKALGRRLLADLEAGDRQGLVLISRSYNCFDTGLNLNLPKRLAAMGFTVLPMDLLPLEGVRVDERLNLFWKRGRQMVQAAAFVADHARLHAVLLTNHSCGPDAFLKGYVERVMGDKPLLTLELDGHGADTGYITRLEAFCDVVRDDHATGKKAVVEPAKPCLPPSKGWAENPERLWIPYMHPYASPFVAASLRHRGRSAEALPPESARSLRLGKQHCHGGECLPVAAIMGSFLETLGEPDPERRESLFIPGASYGPCRYGQHRTLNRLILEEAGFPRVRVEGMRGDGGEDDGDASAGFLDATIVSDLLYKARCRLRPYDRDPPGFDDLMQRLVVEMGEALEAGDDLGRLLASMSRRLRTRPRANGRRPLVGVVGELYLRYNPFTNGGLVELIEEEGGEAWVEPLVPWFEYLAWQDGQIARVERSGARVRLRLAIKRAAILYREHSLKNALAPLLRDRPEPGLRRILAAGAQSFPRHYYGEPPHTVGRAQAFAQFGADLILNVAPFRCMSGRMTACVFRRLELEKPLRVVTLYYDGESDVSPLVRTHMAVLRSRLGSVRRASLEQRSGT